MDANSSVQTCSIVINYSLLLEFDFTRWNHSMGQAWNNFCFYWNSSNNLTPSLKKIFQQNYFFFNFIEHVFNIFYMPPNNLFIFKNFKFIKNYFPMSKKYQVWKKISSGNWNKKLPTQFFIWNSWKITFISRMNKYNESSGKQEGGGSGEIKNDSSLLIKYSFWSVFFL